MQDTLGLFGGDVEEAAPSRSLASVAEQPFHYPATSFLDGKSGVWLDRKREWIATGIKSEVGRDVVVYATVDKEYWPKFGTETSVFDPVLCELAYTWYCPVGGQIVDPFAGGSVRGLVAGALGRRYWGCDLRREQIDANNAQSDLIAQQSQPSGLVCWVCGDSAVKLADAPAADFIFSCPPYGDLEEYSDDPDDLSNMEWDDFLVAYRDIIAKSVALLRDDSFACFVVGDFRDKAGYYRNFVAATTAAFEAAGAVLCNDAVLATPIGTAAFRVTRQFSAGRKMAKVHQNILVFCKGNAEIAAKKVIASAT